MRKLIAAALLLCFGVAAEAATVRLTWLAPTACVDGSPISACAITGYEVQHAAQQSDVFAVVRGVGATVTTVTLTDVAPGPHCYFVRANSAAGFSGNSNVACLTVPAPIPNAPTSVTVTITVTIGP